MLDLQVDVKRDLPKQIPILNEVSPLSELNQTKTLRFVINACNSELCGVPMKKRRKEVQPNTYQKALQFPKPEVVLDRISCPVSGCGNFGGRGYKRSYIVKHL